MGYYWFVMWLLVPNSLGLSCGLVKATSGQQTEIRCCAITRQRTLSVLLRMMTSVGNSGESEGTLRKILDEWVQEDNARSTTT